jgi:predicted component of type VI protein secretion system
MTETEETIEQKLARYETVIGLQMQEIDRLRSVVAKMTGTDDAHSTLRRLYLDEAQNPNTRIRAAAASLPHEKPRLAPVAPSLDLVPEPVEPLAALVQRRRARQDALEHLALDDPRRGEWDRSDDAS